MEIRVDRVPGEGYAATVKVVWKVALVIVGLLVLAFLLWRFGSWLMVGSQTHGHVYEPLEVTVRVVDRDTGEPLAGAVVATVRSRSALEWESFESSLGEAFKPEEPGVDRWRHVVCGTKTTEKAETTIRAAVCVTRFWEGTVLTGQETDLPNILLIDHPRHGRTIIPMDPETPVEEGEEPNTWRLDLGTIRVPE